MNAMIPDLTLQGKFSLCMCIVYVCNLLYVIIWCPKTQLCRFGVYVTVCSVALKKCARISILTRVCKRTDVNHRRTLAHHAARGIPRNAELSE